MKSKKGFTLIELLAIIVILAIIAVITVPIILNIIENSKKGAATDSAYGYKDAVSKWYVEKLSLDHNFNLDSSYTVTNGNLGNEQIPFSGDKPTSGYLNYSNNVLTDGCLTFGDYAVTFTNGEVSSTVKGECAAQVQETVLYYTYDANVTTPNPILGYKNSEKEEQPDEDWIIYIKETTQPGETSYGIEITSGENKVLGAGFDTEEECESVLTNFSSGLPSGMSAECKELDYKVTNEVCGVDGTNSFCLKARDYANTVTTLNDGFCSTPITSDTEASCDGTAIDVIALNATGQVSILPHGSQTTVCTLDALGNAGCAAY